MPWREYAEMRDRALAAEAEVKRLTKYADDVDEALRMAF
jgi:hypothetical protein